MASPTWLELNGAGQVEMRLCVVGHHLQCPPAVLDGLGAAAQTDQYVAEHHVCFCCLDTRGSSSQRLLKVFDGLGCAA